MIASIVLLLASVSAMIDKTPIDDRMLAAWVADLTSEDGEKQRNATAALTKAGPKAKPAIPALLKMIDPKTGRGYQAIVILGAIGPDAKEAVPALMTLLPKDDSRGYGVELIAVALAKIDGPKLEASRALLLSSGKCTPILLVVSQTLHEYPGQVVSHVVTLCADKDAKVREKAATVVAGLKGKESNLPATKSVFEKAGDGTKGIPAALEKLLTDENDDVKIAAAKAITHVTPELADKALAVMVTTATEWAETLKKGDFYAHEVFQPVPEKATKALIPLFNHENSRLRMWAINHLSPLPVREPIEDALKNGKTARIRQSAAIALGARYSGSVESVPALKAALSDSEFIVRFAAAHSLVMIDYRDSEAITAAVPVLVEGLQQKEEAVRVQASQDLLRIGEPAKTAIPALKKLLEDKKPEVRLEAALALVGIDKKEAAGTVPALIDGLKLSDSPATRAAKALAELGPVAKDAIPELVKHFDAKNMHLRLYSAEAAARIDPAQVPKAVTVLIGLLKEKKTSMIRSYSLLAIQRIGPAAKDALPTLAELLKDDGPFHADAAIAMITIDSTNANPAFTWIRTVMAKPGDDDAYDLAERLPELGAKAKPLVPDLVKLLVAKSAHFRESAVQTLAAIGPDAKDALPQLKQLAEKDPRNDIRELAAEAIKKIEK